MLVPHDRTITCPYCSWGWTTRTTGVENEEMGLVAAGTHDFWVVTGSTNKSRAQVESLDDANAWVDHPCANCKQKYQYHRKTGEVRQ